MESSMLGFIFGFHMRVGRLHYFLLTLAFAVVVGVLAVLVGGFVVRQLIADQRNLTSLSVMPVLVLIGLTLWSSIFLASMRIRDIGWNPAYVIPIWYLLVAIDFYVARTMPEFAMNKEHVGTVAGGVLQLISGLVLMFWPSTERDMSAPSIPNISEVRTPKYQPQAVKSVNVVPSSRGEPMGRKSFGQLGR
jgi:uncharacterized membrane protein YhaH (DUF805 family)